MRALWVLLLLGELVAGCGSKSVAPLATPENIRSVKLGMSQEQVHAILGEPLSKEPRVVDGMPPREIWVYSRPVSSAFRYPMLWVHFDSTGVVEVYAKKYVYWGADDEGIYGVSQRGEWEKPDFESMFR